MAEIRVKDHYVNVMPCLHVSIKTQVTYLISNFTCSGQILDGPQKNSVKAKGYSSVLYVTRTESSLNQIRITSNFMTRTNRQDSCHRSSDIHIQE